MPDVSEVVVLPDRVEIQSAGTWHTLHFRAIAQWPAPAWLSRTLFSLGIRMTPVPVADRDWCRPPRDRFFSFYSVAPLVVYMPEDEAEGYGDSVFYRIREVIQAAGFGTRDLG